MEPLDLWDRLDHLVLPLVGRPTPGGGRVLARKSKALCYSTLGMLEEVTLLIKELGPITCVCRLTQSTVPTSHTVPGYKDLHRPSGLSTRFLIKERKMTMYHVLFATCPLDPL